MFLELTAAAPLSFMGIKTGIEIGIAFAHIKQYDENKQVEDRRMHANNNSRMVVVGRLDEQLQRWMEGGIDEQLLGWMKRVTS